MCVCVGRRGVCVGVSAETEKWLGLKWQEEQRRNVTSLIALDA